MPLTVIDPGLHSLPVDLGRTGSRALGVPLGGAADRFAFQLGNLLLGNQPNAVAVEVTLKGPTLRAEVETAAVVFGAPFLVTVNGREVPPNTTFRLRVGDTLRIGGTPTGCRAYLCVAGGFDMPEVLGSRSALEPLKAGEVLKCASSGGRGGKGIGYANFGASLALTRSLRDYPLPRKPSPPVTGGEGRQKDSTVSASAVWLPSPPVVEDDGFRGRGVGGEGFFSLRALPGPQADWFLDGGFLDRPFTVAPASNRMGLRLLGEPIPKRPGELASEPVAPGAVQVTNDGLPIVLGVDGQTVGGYPKVAHVIRADLDLLGQLRPGDGVRFARVPADEAEAAADERARELRRWRLRLELTAG